MLLERKFNYVILNHVTEFGTCAVAETNVKMIGKYDYRGLFCLCLDRAQVMNFISGISGLLIKYTNELL